VTERSRVPLVARDIQLLEGKIFPFLQSHDAVAGPSVYLLSRFDHLVCGLELGCYSLGTGEHNGAPE
jgi:hypothetical protein